MRTVVVAKGDGIGPEIMGAVLSILEAAGAKVNVEYLEIGEKLYNHGWNSGISKNAWDLIKKHKVLLKAPITTPQGKGYKSLNVTFRKVLGLFANVRPVLSFQPFVNGPAQKMDMVIIRENEEDLYAGIEYRSTLSSFVSLKLISKAGCEKIIRYAFEYAKVNKRSKVTCVIKDNIMKITDGLFHSTFKEVALEYPEIQADSYIVDIGAARIASKPQIFDVIVTLNLYGDILSDIAAEVSGSIGLAGSCNIGTQYAMFEAVHGSAPDIAGQNVANPSGLLNAAIMMLNHIEQQDVATRIQNAWLKTLESGLHTVDIFTEKSTQKLSTTEFTQAVIDNLGQLPAHFAPVVSKTNQCIHVALKVPQSEYKTLVGLDVYLMDHAKTAAQLATALSASPVLRVHSIAQRGLLIWPSAEIEDVNTGMMRLRFVKSENETINQKVVLDLLQYIVDQGFEIAMTHTLYQYDGVDGFSKTQGDQ